jgi:predicted membrane protein
LPLDLTIEGGASENTFDFSGLRLTQLNIVQGASDTTIRFDTPNPVLMQDFIFKTGASSAKIYGLGNANFVSMNMSCGAGDYTLDFGGSLAQDSTVDIKSGMSNITIIIPADMNATINNQGTVSNINTQGTWLVQNETYQTMVVGPTLTINLDMAVGNVNLIHEE